MVFEYSAYTSFEPIGVDQPLLVKRIIDKDKRYEYWINVLQEAKEVFPKKHVDSILKSHIPGRLVDALISHYGLPGEWQVTDIHKDSMKTIAHLL